MTRSKEQTPTFEVNQILQPVLKCLDALFTFSNPHQISIPVYNPTAEDILVGEHEELANIEFWSDQSTI